MPDILGRETDERLAAKFFREVPQPAISLSDGPRHDDFILRLAVKMICKSTEIRPADDLTHTQARRWDLCAPPSRPDRAHQIARRKMRSVHRGLSTKPSIRKRRSDI